MFFKPFAKTKRRRGISEIVGSLFMLAIVVPVGVVILSQGLFEVTDFNRFLSVTREQGIDAVQEDLVFEHVRFDPSSEQLTIHLRNISNVETYVDRVSVVKIDSQELLVYNTTVTTGIPLKTVEKIIVYADLPADQWDVDPYKDGDYKISVTTLRGNFFDTVARPFNT